MAWEFRVGMKVVCIDDDFNAQGFVPVFVTDLPMRGNVYTISRIEADDDGIWLFLEEVASRIDVIGGWCEASFGSEGFRPLRERKTDISVFRALLNTNEKKVEA